MIGCGGNSKQDPLPSSAPSGPLAYPSTPIDITNIYQKEDISVFVLDIETGVGLEGEEVSITTLPPIYGSIESSKVTTDASGKAIFKYTGPSTLEELTSTIVILSYIDENNNISTQNIVINFGNDNPGGGGASTISLTYAGTEKGAGVYIDEYRVHAVDIKSNQPIVGMAITASLVNDVKVQQAHALSGSILNTIPVGFDDVTINYLNAGVGTNDNLIIIPSSGKTDPAYIGGWTISDVAANHLTFTEEYSNGISAQGLNYIVGSERRLLGRKIGVADVTYSADTPLTDEEGYTSLFVVYDTILAGHTITLEVHGDYSGNRVGIGQVVSLRGDEFSAAEVTTKNNGGLKQVPMLLTIGGGIEHLIDVDIVPSSIIVEPLPHCILNEGASDFHTDNSGQISIAVNTDGNTSETGGVDICTVNWIGGAGSIYLEY